jgi:hypothetical protein
MTSPTKVPTWVAEGYSGLGFKNIARERRFQKIVAAASKRPGGRVSDVFGNAAERQGAYDFLEHDSVSADMVRLAVGARTAKLCAKDPFVYVPLDGSSLALTDRTGGRKDFGSVGARSKGARGLKVITGYAVDRNGIPRGVLGQMFWARSSRRANKRKYRKLEQRESFKWHQAVDEIEKVRASHAPELKLHFLIDREGDASFLMQRLVEAQHDFTIRANGTRNVLIDEERVNVLSVLGEQRAVARMVVEVPAAANRAARTAVLEVKTAEVSIVTRDRHLHRRGALPLWVVQAREVGGPPGASLNWLLYTTKAVSSGEDAIDTVRRYSYRWRIEEFHRAWKTGHCCVEETQLRSMSAVIKWASILAVAAQRAEELKQQSRKDPNQPATVLLTPTEIKALILLKRDEKRKNEEVPDGIPSLGQAVRWLADLGSYIGPWNGPPGAKVIARGLERVLPAAQVLATLEASGKLR